ncbi:MAG: phospholipid carrier-dependent glycosyltransferase [Myxococcota bacterium]
MRAFGRRLLAWTTDERSGPWLLFVVALIPRVVFVVFAHPVGDFIESDMSVYDLRAKNLVRGELGPWDTFTPAGYPAALALVYRAFGRAYLLVGGLQALLSALTVLVTYKLAFSLSRDRTVPVISSIAVAAHLPMILYTGLLLSETWFAFLLVLSAWLLVESTIAASLFRAILGGFTLGVAATVRPSLALVVPLLPVFFYVALRRSAPRTFRYGFCALVFALCPMLIHSAHNSSLLERWVPTSTNGGVNFYLNFADVRSVGFVEGGFKHLVSPIPSRIRHETDELVDRPFYDDGYFYERGVELIAAEPSRLLRVFWSLKEGLGLGSQHYWPSWRRWRYVLPVDSRLFSLFFVVPGVLWLLYSFARGRPFRAEEAGWLWLSTLLGCSVVTMAFFLGDPRIRVPYDPFFAIAAAAAYVELGRHVRRKRRRAKVVTDRP